MQITLRQKDIEQAIRTHLTQQGINTVGKDVTAVFTQTRKGGAGITAQVNIEESTTHHVEMVTDLPIERIKPEVKDLPVKAETQTASLSPASIFGSIAPS